MPMTPSEAHAKVRELFPEQYAQDDPFLSDDIDGHYISGWYNALRGFDHKEEDYRDYWAGYMGYCDCLGITPEEE
jgi:hypothetical protein